MKELLTLYRDRLTDLTARNKSLRLLQLAVKNHFDLARLDMSRIVAEVMAQKEFVYLFPQNNVDEDGILNNQRMIKLKREMDLIEQDTGHNPFYVAFGFLEGELADDFYIRCPLLFYPAKLIKSSYRNKPYWTLAISEEDYPFINRAFLMATQKLLGADLGLSETELDLPSEPDAALNWLQKWLDDHGLKVQFESGAKLRFFPNLKRKDIESGSKTLRLHPYAVMGKFQQSTSTLVNDYEELLNNPPESGFLYDVMSGVSRSELDGEGIPEDILNTTPPSETFFVLDTDASQEAAVLASRDKKGLIVHGPPGTGKSQVIVNMIVDRLAQDQRVLVVCQKKTALDVVYNRLGQIGLQGSVALVHDYNQNKADVYRKVTGVMQQTAPDSVNMERVSDEKQALAEKLNKIARSLHTLRPFGKTLFTLYNQASWENDSLIQVDDLLSGITYDELQAQLLDLRTIIELMEMYDNHNHPWSQRKSFAVFSMRERSAIAEVMVSIMSDAELAETLQHAIKINHAPIHYARHNKYIENFLNALTKPFNHHTGSLTLLALSAANEGKSLSEVCAALRIDLNDAHRQISALARLPEAESRLLLEDAKSRLSTITSFLVDNRSILRFIKKGWRQKKKDLMQYCESMGIQLTPESLIAHSETLKSYIEHETLREKVKKHPLLSDAPVHNISVKWQEWLQQKEDAYAFLETLAPIVEYFPDWLQLRQQDEVRSLFEDKTQRNSIKQTLDYAKAVDRVIYNLDALRPYLREDMIIRMIEHLSMHGPDIAHYRSLQQTLNHFDSLCRLDQMKAEMGRFKATLLERCQTKYSLADKGTVAETWIRMIQNSFYYAWILSVEEAEPHIKDVSTEIFEKHRSRFKQLTVDKRKTNPLLVQKKLFSRTATVTGSVRTTLKHEAGKKRSQLPLRQVISHFQEPVLSLLPCWLCTPEAVSAIFPLTENLFDLVIFDEASQCPVENAIPAIYRAKQLVVAGDEKQLPPSNFFKSTVDEDSDEEEEEAEGYVDQTDKEAKSLLEWSKPKFFDAWLTWHYRSSFGELISFSNAAFYNDYMQIAPAVTKRGTGKPIDFHEVKGRWENSVNRTEAEKIVELVFELLQSDDHPTIGVIAFNQKQAALIGDLLEQAAYDDPVRQSLLDREKARKNGEENIGLFVKNIENVQGDERDIILFSVTYAKDANDRMVSNFGPLSTDGGENRLNVAISRARQKIHIVCSFDPSEWVRAETYAKGVRLFKKYLEYGKAVSDGKEERAETILSNLLDGSRLHEDPKELQYDSVFEEQVAEALRKRNYEVHTQVGFSGYRIDLAIVDPNEDRYILGIECDGAMYHSSKVARERDMYRQRFLESKGWTIHRIWSRNWWISREHELLKIDAIVAKLSRKSSEEN